MKAEGRDLPVSGVRHQKAERSEGRQAAGLRRTPAGEGVISPDRKYYIFLDSIFAQTISTDQYQVFLQSYGDGNCYVSERHGSYFVVSGTPNLSFGWELKAKQSDFDQLRLERNNKEFTIPSQTYGINTQQYLNDIKKSYNFN